MQIAGHNVDPSDVIAAIAVLVSLFFYRQNQGIAADSKSMAAANKMMAETNMSMADSAKLSAQAALDAAEFQRKADLLARKACLRLAREQGSEGLMWFPVDNTVEDPSGKVLPTAWLEIYVTNEGKAPATNCRMRLSSSDTPKRMRIEDSAVKRIAPGEAVKFGFLVPYIPLKEADHDIGFSVRFSFEDQLGQDTYSTGIEFSPNQEESRYVNDPDWRVRVVPEFEIRHQLCKPPGEDDEDYYED